jgi:hypothetical protein
VSNELIGRTVRQGDTRVRFRRVLFIAQQSDENIETTLILQFSIPTARQSSVHLHILYLMLFGLLCVRFDMAKVENSRRRALSFCIICTSVRIPSRRATSFRRDNEQRPTVVSNRLSAEHTFGHHGQGLTSGDADFVVLTEQKKDHRSFGILFSEDLAVLC